MWEPDPDTMYFVYSLALGYGEVQRGQGMDNKTYGGPIPLHRDGVVQWVDRGHTWKFKDHSPTHEYAGWSYRPVELRNPNGRTWR